MKHAAILLIGVFGLHGCASATVTPSTTPALVLPTLTISPPLAKVVTLTDATPLAYYRAQPVVGLVQVPDIATNQGRLGLVLWGTRTAAQPIVQVTEEQVLGGKAKLSVHVFFDEKMQPVLARDDASGYSIAIDRRSRTQSTITLCDARFSAIASVSLTQHGRTSSIGQPTNGGSCTVRNADLRGTAGPLRGPGKDVSQPQILSSLQKVQKLITAGSYLSGLAFSIGAIFKFKEHKDNPNQVLLQNIYLALAVMFAPALFHANDQTQYLQRSQASAVVGVRARYQPQESLPGCSATAPPGQCPFPHPEPTPKPSV